MPQSKALNLRIFACFAIAWRILRSQPVVRTNGLPVKKINLRFNVNQMATRCVSIPMQTTAFIQIRRI